MRFLSLRGPLIVLALVLFSGCWIPGEEKDPSFYTGFLCGAATSSDPKAAAACARPGEVCVCETWSCARPVPERECRSKLRYVEEPFARTDNAERCVAGTSTASILDVAAGQSFCVLQTTTSTESNGEGE